MTKITNEQLAFARSMSARQWAVLARLADGVWFLSASERSDPELYRLVQYRLAACGSMAPPTPSRGLILPTWEATKAGTVLLKRRATGALT